MDSWSACKSIENLIFDLFYEYNVYDTGTYRVCRQFWKHVEYFLRNVRKYRKSHAVAHTNTLNNYSLANYIFNYNLTWVIITECNPRCQKYHDCYSVPKMCGKNKLQVELRRARHLQDHLHSLFRCMTCWKDLSAIWCFFIHSTTTYCTFNNISVAYLPT